MAIASSAPARPHKRRLRALLTAVAVGVGLMALPIAATPAHGAPPAGMGSVSLRVLDDTSGAAVAGAWAEASAVDGSDFAELVTSASGVAVFDLAPGDYEIAVASDRHVLTYYPGTPDWLLAEAVTVVAGQTLDLQLRIQRGGTASMTVELGAGGAPASGAFVDLWSVNADGSFASGTSCETDASGTCVVDRLPPGDYRAFASFAPGDARGLAWGSGGWPIGGPPIRIDDQQRVEGTITMAAATRVTADVHLDFTHEASAIDVLVGAVYYDALDPEPIPIGYASGAPGSTVSIELGVEPGRPFRLQVDGYRADDLHGDRILMTQQWTPTGMAELGAPIMVEAGQPRSFSLTGHLGATLSGSFTVVADAAATAPAAAGTRAEAPGRTPYAPMAQRPAAPAASAPLTLDREQPMGGAPRAAGESRAVATGDVPAAAGDLMGVDVFRMVRGQWVYADSRWLDEPRAGRSQPFEITGLTPGDYLVGFWGDAVCAELWEDAWFFEDASRIGVTHAGQTAAIAAQLEPIAGGCRPPGGSTELPEADRIAGANRFVTSVAISQATFAGTAPVVYLASGTNFPDGLAAGPAAAHQGGPVLLTRRESVSQAVLDEIERLDPAQVVIVGGEPSVSAAAERQVRALGGGREIVRLGGANRYETSQLIAEHAFGGAEAAFLATGRKFPDALAAGPAASLLGGPVLLVRGTETAPDADTQATLDALGVQWVGLAGDGNSIATGIEAGLRGGGFVVERFAGANRFATAARIGELFEFPATVVVASGQGFADALPGAAAAGTVGAPMLLSRSGCLPAEAAASLQWWLPSQVVLLGGTPTLGAGVAEYRQC